jgi:hypothetical protein
MMSFRISKAMIPEERVAKRIKAIVEDLDLDLEQTGIMLARILPHLTFTRLQAIMEVANDEKDLILNPQKRNERWKQHGLW